MRVRNRLFRYAVIPMALFASLVATPHGHAEDGRNFSGFYELSDVTDLGDTVSVTISLEIFNHRDAGVYDVILTVRTSTGPEADLFTMTSPFIGSGESVLLSGDVVLPREEHKRWRQGISPMPYIDFSDVAGSRTTNLVELVPGP